MSGLPPLPAGATAASPQLPPGASPAKAGAAPAAFDHDSIKSLWIRAGGEPEVADLMAHVAEAESSGIPTATNHYAEKGKTHMVSGLWQISDEHGKPSYFDPMENAKTAVGLYNARVAHGQTGFEDWEASRDKWGKYLPGAENNPPPLPPGAVAAGTPQHSDTVTPSHRTPLPPSVPYVEGKNRPKNEDPRLGNYNIAESAAGHQELPFMLANAQLWDMLDKTGGKHVADVLDLWKPRVAGGKGNPAAASAIYGTNSPRVLEMYARSGNPALEAYAKVLQSNSKLAGAATFAEEWFNPLAWVEGKAVGKTVLPGLMKIPGVEAGVNRLMQQMSIYKGIVNEHGEGPRNVLATIGQRLSRASSQGHEAMMDVFAGHSAPEQEEIVRRQQNLPANRAIGNDERNALIDAAAKRKRDLTREMTAARLASGDLKKNQVRGVKGSAPTKLYHDGKLVGEFSFDPGTYHGLKDQYNHPNDMYNGLLEQLDAQGRTPHGSGGGPSVKRATYDNIDEAKAGKDGSSLLKGDIDHADLFRKFMSTGKKRVEFWNGMRELAERHPDVITVPTSAKQRLALMNSGKYIPISDVKNSGIALFKDQAPAFMKQAMISPAFRDFLGNKNSLAATLGRSVFEPGGSQGSASKWVAALDNAYRASIVANPGYHPFWNVAPNATAAAGKSGPTGLATMMLNQTRALLGVGASVSHALGHVPVVGGMAKAATKTLDAAREGLEHPFLSGVESWQNAMHAALEAGQTAHEAAKAGRAAATEEALHAGAGAEFGGPKPVWGGSPGRIFTRPVKDPVTGKFTPVSSQERMERMVTAMDQWNQQGTFNARGEQGFAVTLFHQLHGKGGLFEGDPYAAAWAVREALGNYRNLDPDNWMTKTMMFFPWLASNVPFWFKAFTKTPQFVTAPTQASRTQRENAGDPTAYDASHPHMGISIYEGEGRNREVPLPFKDTEKFAQAGYDAVTGDPQSATDLVEGEAAARAKPLIGAAFNTVMTALDSRAHPEGSYAGYEVMYDKNEPDQRNAQLLKSWTIGLAPTPLAVRDIIRQGYDPGHMADYIQEGLGMGYISERTADNFKKATNTAANKLETMMAKSRKIQAGPHPMTEDQLHKFQKAATDAYEARMERIRAMIQQSKQKGSGLPPLPSGATATPPLPSGAVATR